MGKQIRDSVLSRVCRRFDSKFKSRVALEAIRGLRSSSDIAKHIKVHPNQVTLWKKQLLEGAESVFEGGTSSRMKADDEPDTAELNAEIVSTQMELEWPKKVAEKS